MKAIDNLYIVDDDEIYQYTTRRTIENTKGVKKITSFSNGKDALDHYSKSISSGENIPDIILLDLNMPIMNGWEFLEHYARIKPTNGKKVILCIVTSSVHPDDYSRAKHIAEVDNYIIKPITLEKFSSIMSLLEA